MARHGERLPYASRTGEPIRIVLTAEQWALLEQAMGRHVLLGARESFEDICNDYLSNEQLEQAAVRTADVKRCAEHVRHMVAPFLQFAYGQPLNPKGISPAAWAEFQSQFDDVIQSFAIPLPPAPDGELGAETTDRVMHLTIGTITEVAIRVSAALSKIEKGGGISEVFEGSEGIEIGSAFRGFVRQAREWAKTNNLPFGPMASTDDKAAPFASFMHATVSLLPTDIVPEVSSPQAMAERIRRANVRNS